MGKFIDRGWLPPDDEIYRSGPVIGGVRFYGKRRPPAEDPKPKRLGKPRPQKQQ